MLTVDAISDRHLARALPQTVAVLQGLGYVRFNNHSIVGPGSGDNLVPLFSGVPLAEANQSAPWLWDQFA